MQLKVQSMIRCLAVALLTMLVGNFANAQKVKHVVLIGVDGMGAGYISPTEMPTLASLMTTGSYSLHARSVLPSSSADNWASMFMGASPELHGYTVWDSKTPEIPSRVLDQYGLFPSIFGILHEQQPKADIGVFYDWAGIGYLFPKQAVTTVGVGKDDSEVVEQAVRYIKSNKPTLTLAYFDAPDGAGHSIGWGTSAYSDALKQTDQHIAQILAAIQDAGISGSTIVIISADHGGINKGHGGKTLKEMEIPWFIAGPRVKRGNEIKSSIMTYDTAATIAYLLHLKAPQVWIGRPVTAALAR